MLVFFLSKACNLQTWYNFYKDYKQNKNYIRKVQGEQMIIL